MGSSSNKRSGWERRRRQSATRRRSPPERVATSASPGGQRSASMAMSSVRCSSQPLQASIFSCSSACSAISAFMASSSSGSPNLAETSSNRSSSAFVSFTPSMTLPSTSLLSSSCGSCSRKPTLTPSAAQASPEKSCSIPAMTSQQRRLAGAVDAQDADLGPGQERQRDVFEDLLPAGEGLGEVPHHIDVLVGRHGHASSRAQGVGIAGAASISEAPRQEGGLKGCLRRAAGLPSMCARAASSMWHDGLFNATCDGAGDAHPAA